jgi:hypothetical protein
MTTTFDTTLDDRLDDVRRNLIAEFAATVPADAVQEVVQQSLAQYRNARVADFVPLFVQLEVRRRLAEIAYADSVR